MKPTASATLVIALCGLIISAQPASPQGTAFTYQGRLTDNGSQPNGNYDMRFYLRDALSGGNPVGTTNTLAPLAVSNGLFTTLLDFGANIFTGPARWLEIGVRTNGSTGAYSTLAPRQALTPTLYAITASNLTGTLPASQLTGILPSADLAGTYSGALTLTNAANNFTGNGSGLNNVNAASLGGLSSASFWQTLGNAGTTAGLNFLGTTDNQPLEIKVNGMRAMRLEPNGIGEPNVLGGVGTSVAPGTYGSTIGGGYFCALQANESTIGGGARNTIRSNAVWATISGGNANAILTNSSASTIAGGIANTIQTDAQSSTICGGYVNSIQSNASYSTIGGGYVNSILPNAGSSTIAGGSQNVVQTNAYGNAIGGGQLNTVQTNVYLSTIGGGIQNTNGASYSALGGGFYNLILPSADSSVIAGGNNNTINSAADHATISGGEFNSIAANVFGAAIGGGLNNQAAASHATVSGGDANTASGPWSSVGGGRVNRATSFLATIAGGDFNQANGDRSTVAGGSHNNALGYLSTVGGGLGNMALGTGAVIGGGGDGTTTTNNLATGGQTVIGGGVQNTAVSSFSTVAGGATNVVQDQSPYSSIGGGEQNFIASQAIFATISGGQYNTIGLNANNATVGGGGVNFAGSSYATVGGGLGNTASGFFSMVPGGVFNTAGGESSFAAGRRAKANNGGAFVWADKTDADIVSSADNQFTVRASGGVRFFSDSAATVGVQLAAGGNSWAPTSDRNMKENFQPANVREVLRRVAALPVLTYNMKTQDPAIRHIGPMAQDFRAAFQVGEDDKHITTIDADGVALAAIQGLSEVLNEKDAEIQRLKAQIAGLNAGQTRSTADWETRFTALETIVLHSSDGTQK